MDRSSLGDPRAGPWTGREGSPRVTSAPHRCRGNRRTWRDVHPRSRQQHLQDLLLTIFFVCLPLWDLILNSEEAYLLSIVISHEKLKL